MSQSDRTTMLGPRERDLWFYISELDIQVLLTHFERERERERLVVLR